MTQPKSRALPKDSVAPNGESHGLQGGRNIEFPTKHYNTIVIDPPWQLSMAGHKRIRPTMAEQLPYSQMSLEELKELPIESIASIGAHIYLWATNQTIQDAFELFKTWHTNFHLMLVWTKPSGIAPALAYQFATEFCLLGFHGKPMQKFSGEVSLNWFEGRNNAFEHSKKPDVFYKLVERMSPAPYIDIFARRHRIDWDVYGDDKVLERQSVLIHNLKDVVSEPIIKSQQPHAEDDGAY